MASRPVIALSRGLEVLRVINQERHSTVGSLHKATGLNKATIVRMLETARRSAPSLLRQIFLLPVARDHFAE
jgi:hypothetical protein